MLHLDALALRRRLPFDTLIEALRRMMLSGCEVPPRVSHAIGKNGTVLVMPAWRRGGPEGSRFGIKTVTIYPANGERGLPAVHAVYALFDAETGVPLALLDGSELTARRTAAVSALAAGFLARADATRLVVVGAGRVAALVPEAMRSVLVELRQVTVWNRHPAAAAALAERLRSEGWAAEPSTDLEAAIRQADVVSCATLATVPLVHGQWLRVGSHLDLIGGFTPLMREADSECLARGRVYVGSDEAMLKAGDLVQAVAEGRFEPILLQGTLQQLCRGSRAGRGDDGEITVFKSVGSALEDLATAELAVAAADNPLPASAFSAKPSHAPSSP